MKFHSRILLLAKNYLPEFFPFSPVIHVISMLYCDFALQYLYGAPKPEEDSALKRMLGKTLVPFFLFLFCVLSLN